MSESKGALELIQEARRRVLSKGRTHQGIRLYFSEPPESDLFIRAVAASETPTEDFYKVLLDVVMPALQIETQRSFFENVRQGRAVLMSDRYTSFCLKSKLSAKDLTTYRAGLEHLLEPPRNNGKRYSALLAEPRPAFMIFTHLLGELLATCTHFSEIVPGEPPDERYVHLYSSLKAGEHLCCVSFLLPDPI